MKRILFWIFITLFAIVSWAIIINGNNNFKKKFKFLNNSRANNPNFNKHKLEIQPPDPYILASLPINKKLRHPVGTESGAFYYDAQPFIDISSGKHHLGSDLNGLGGDNTDLGDPIFSIGNGFVIYQSNTETEEPGWGKVMLVLYKLKNNYFITALYAHLHEFLVINESKVYFGEKIATIGNANARYLAHLHFEIFKSYNLNIGKGYSKNINKIVLSRTSLGELAKNKVTKVINKSDHFFYKNLNLIDKKNTYENIINLK